MLLMLDTNDLSRFFRDFIRDSFTGIIYCLDVETYHYLKSLEIMVDIAYLSHGKVYLCDGSIYEGVIIVKEDRLYDEFLRYNRCYLSQNSEYKDFVNNYEYITTQEDYMVDIT